MSALRGTEWEIKAFVRPFDLEKGPLYRFEILETNEGNVFLYDIHHIITDGTSERLFVAQIAAIYEKGDVVDEEEISEADFALSEIEHLKTEEYEKTQNFYVEILSGADTDSLPVPDMIEDVRIGGAYMSLDPTNTEERLNLMMRHSGATLLISTKELEGIIKPDFKGKRIMTDEIPSLDAKTETLPEPKMDDMFVILYTSGSTGTLKGEIFRHSNSLIMTLWVKKYFDITEKSRVTAYASYGFDEMKIIDAPNRNGIGIFTEEDEKYYEEFNRKLGDDRVNEGLNGIAAYDIKDAHAVETDNLFTTDILYRMGSSWPLVDDAYLDRAINSIMTLDFFSMAEQEED